MAHTLFMKRVLGTLVPTDRHSEELLKGLPDRTCFKVEVRQPRNVDHHRKYWALIQAIFPHQSQYATTRHLHEALKLSVGHFDMIESLKGVKVPVTRETNFNKMDQKEFEQFYDKVVELILTRLLPGVGKAHLEAQVVDILDGSKAA